MDDGFGTRVEQLETTERPRGLWRFFAYSLIGIFMFFIPINIAGKETIPHK